MGAACSPLLAVDLAPFLLVGSALRTTTISFFCASCALISDVCCERRKARPVCCARERSDMAVSLFRVWVAVGTLRSRQSVNGSRAFLPGLHLPAMRGPPF